MHVQKNKDITGVHVTRFRDNSFSKTSGISTNAGFTSFNGLQKDVVTFKARPYLFKSSGKTTSIISFTAKPRVPSYAFKTELEETHTFQHNCKTLDKSNWKDGDTLELVVNKGNMDVIHPEIGKLGIIPESIMHRLVPLIQRGYQFKAELADIDGKGTKTDPVGLRVNLQYDLKPGETLNNIPVIVQRTINNILKSPASKHQTRPYQPPTTPEEFMKILVPEPIVSNIMKEINKAHSILLVSHKSADGDAIGCVLGLGAALEVYGKAVDCSIDDDIDGHYRHKLPGIDEKLKRPAQLDAHKKYDLAIVMDTPTPRRIGDNGKFIKEAKKVIYIDHHEVYRNNWKADPYDSGVNIDEIERNNLLWVNDKMPAATQMITALIFKLLSPEVKEKLSLSQKQQIAKPLVAGMATDTDFFRNGTDKKVESVSKFLMNWASFGKKWIRDTIQYDLPAAAAKEMNEYATKPIVDDVLGFAYIKIPYDNLMKVYNIAQKDDPDIIMQDVTNAVKYSDSFRELKDNPNTGKNDRVTALLIQRTSKEVEGEDEITVNLRSPEGTKLARHIAEYLGGGGHDERAFALIKGHSLDEPVYDDIDNPAQKLTLEAKISQIIEKSRVKKKIT
jgi:nanoRNase/pAp phosphatase (c-di-AMP/oligoRNAs hydrolase)